MNPSNRLCRHQKTRLTGRNNGVCVGLTCVFCRLPQNQYHHLGWWKWSWNICWADNAGGQHAPRRGRVAGQHSRVRHRDRQLKMGSTDAKTMWQTTKRLADCQTVPIACHSEYSVNSNEHGRLCWLLRYIRHSDDSLADMTSLKYRHGFSYTVPIAWFLHWFVTWDPGQDWTSNVDPI